jgi:FtsZ-binding cell division protein ZapB
MILPSHTIMSTPTQSNVEDPPQMSTMNLIALISSVNSLQQSMSEIRDENTKLKTSIFQLQQDNEALRKEAVTRAEDLAVLQANSGVLFPQFKVRHLRLWLNIMLIFL